MNSLAIRAPPGSGPSHVRIFVNAIGVDCASAQALPPTQVVELLPEDLEAGRQIPLHVVKFGKVDSLTLFFPGNSAGEEHTVVTSLRVFGSVVPNEGAAWAQAEDLQEARKKARRRGRSLLSFLRYARAGRLAGQGRIW